MTTAIPTYTVFATLYNGGGKTSFEGLYLGQSSTVYVVVNGSVLLRQTNNGVVVKTLNKDGSSKLLENANGIRQLVISRSASDTQTQITIAGKLAGFIASSSVNVFQYVNGSRIHELVANNATRLSQFVVGSKQRSAVKNGEVKQNQTVNGQKVFTLTSSGSVKNVQYVSGGKQAILQRVAYVVGVSVIVGTATRELVKSASLSLSQKINGNKQKTLAQTGVSKQQQNVNASKSLGYIISARSALTQSVNALRVIIFSKEGAVTLRQYASAWDYIYKITFTAPILYQEAQQHTLYADPAKSVSAETGTKATITEPPTSETFMEDGVSSYSERRWNNL